MRRLRLSAIVLSAFLLLGLPTSTPALGTPLTRDEIDWLLGSQESFAREEVARLLLAVVAMADEEITRTAEEAVKAAALDLAPELARARKLSEEWRSEAERRQREAGVLKGIAIVEAAAMGVLAAVLCVRETAR